MSQRLGLASRGGRAAGARARTRGLVAVALLLAALAGAGPAPGAAPEPAAPAPAAGAGDPADVSAQDLAVLIAILEDEEARAELVSQLRALQAARAAAPPSAPPPEPAGFGAILLGSISEGLAAAGSTASALARELGDVGRLTAWLEESVRDPAQRGFWLRAAATLVATLAVGLLASLVVTRLLAGARSRIEERPPASLLARAGLLLGRLPLELLPVLAFGAAAYATLAVASADETVRLVTVAGVNAVVIARVALVGVRLALTPLAPNLRPIPLSDETAAYTYVWTARFVNVAVYGVFFGEAARLLGAPPASHAALVHGIGLLTAGLAVVLVLQLRAPVARWIAGSGRGTGTLTLFRRRLADVWHLLALIYLFGVYATWALDLEGGFAFLLRGTLGTLAALAIARLAVLAFDQTLERVFRVRGDLRRRFPELQERASRYQPAARALGLAAIALAAGLGVLGAWRIDVWGALASEAGRDFLTRSARILLILIGALAFWEGARLLVGRRLASSDGSSPRLLTLLPLAQSAILVVTVTLVTMTILSELGMNIGPLLAGAGVIGLAIGFGAQTLVKDVITGAFILFEDAVAVGDVVEVAGYTGIVEAISIRSIRHRDLSGVVHTVPFSTVDVVRNYTKDFSYYLMDVGVAYREDTDEVTAVMREVLDAQRADPEYADAILEPLEVLGVNSFDDSAVAIRARIKTLPRQQWRVGREYRRRLKQRFDELGIEIPFPHRTLYFGVDKDGSAPPARVRFEPEGEAGGDAATRATPPSAPAPARTESSS